MAAPARYYDGVTAEAHDVGAKPGIGELLIFRPGDFAIVARWPFDAITVLGDSEHEALPTLRRAGSEARLLIHDPTLRQQIATAAPQLAALARPAPAPGRRLARYGSTLLALLALVWLGIDYGSEYAAPLAPYTLQAKLGRAVRDELVAGHALCQGRAGLEALNGLANRLARAAGHRHWVTVQVVKGGPLNAFTLPGDILIFYSDLIDRAREPAQVAGVLAHEIGHVVNDHPIKGIAREYGTDFLMRMLTGGYSDINTLASGGGLLLALRNGRGFERQADATGVALLEKLGLRADGISSFFADLLEKEPADVAASIGIWSSHPPTKERIAATRRPATGKPPFSDAEWAAVRAVCETTSGTERSPPIRK